jgi:hypothetical protein
MARLHRKELKHDEFVDTVDRVLLYVEEHGRRLAALAVAIVLGSAAVGGYWWHSGQQAEKASIALGAAMVTFEAPVQAGLPSLPGQGTERVFSSEEEKWQAALEEFAAVREEYAGTQAGLLARHYEGVCKLRLGQQEPGLAALEEVSRASDPEVAALAKLHLAGFYQGVGREEEAEKFYRELSEKPTATVPKAVALFDLAALVAEKNPAEARQLYQQVKDEFPDTPIAAEVTRRLELLPESPQP